MARKTRTPERVRNAIAALTTTNGYPPSLADVAKLVGVSRTRAHSAAQEEVRAGRLTHDPGVPRSWKVVATT
jgi:hypothetical protein